jgi:hypothetical protein
MVATTTGYNNIGIGSYAMQDVTTGNNNVAIGNASLKSNLTGGGNIAIGTSALINATASVNTVVGAYSGGDITSGSENTLIGYNTGRGITTGKQNTIIGSNVTGLPSTLENNVIIADGQGNQRIRVFNTGNVSIGYGNTPTDGWHKLDVNGTIHGTDLGNTKVISIDRNGGTNSNATAGFAYNYINPTVGNYINGYAFYTGGSSGGLHGAPSFAIKHTIDGPIGTSLSGVSTDFMVNWTGTGTPFSAMRIAAQTGNVIIGGTVDGGYNFDVTGTGRFKNTIRIETENHHLDLWRSDGVTRVGAVSYSGQILRLQGVDGHDFTDSTNVRNLRIFANGNVLIQRGGTHTDAGFKLDVQGTTRVQSISTTETTSTVRRIASQTGNLLEFQNESGTVLSSFNSNGVLSDSGLSSNVPLKDAVNIYSTPNIFNGDVTFNGNVASTVLSYVMRGASTGGWTRGYNIADSANNILTSFRFSTADGIAGIFTGSQYIGTKSSGHEISTNVTGNVALKVINTVTNATGNLQEWIRGTTTLASLSSTGAFTTNSSISLEGSGNLVFTTGGVVRNFQIVGASAAFPYSNLRIGTSTYDNTAIAPSIVVLSNRNLQHNSTAASFLDSANLVPPIVGSGNYISFQAKPTVNKQTGDTGHIYGFHYNPTITNLGTGRNIAIETVTGDVLLNTTSGNTVIGSTVNAGFKLDVQGTTRLNGQTEIHGSLEVIRDATAKFLLLGKINTAWKFGIQSEGNMIWYDESGNPDATLYRNTSNSLRTNGNMYVIGSLYSTSLTNLSGDSNSKFIPANSGPEVITAVASNIGLKIQNSATTPTGDLTQWITGANNIVARVTSTGFVDAAGFKINGSDVFINTTQVINSSLLQDIDGIPPTEIIKLDTPGNWDEDGRYTGPPLVNCGQGTEYYTSDDKYYIRMRYDNDPRRILIG